MRTQETVKAEIYDKLVERETIMKQANEIELEIDRLVSVVRTPRVD